MTKHRRSSTTRRGPQAVHSTSGCAGLPASCFNDRGYQVAFAPRTFRRRSGGGGLPRA